MSPATPTVHLVDDDASYLAATSRLLRASGFAVKTYGRASDFLAQCGPDAAGCVIVDLQMPGLDGLELQARLARCGNPLPLLFLTGYGDIPSSVRAMRAGAEDFLEKRAPQRELVDAVRRALARDAREREARTHQDALRARFCKLSERELEVLSHVLRGRLNKQIAADLRINERTVKLHRSAIMAKVEVRAVAALAQMAQEAGLAPAAAATFPKGQ
jgi:FixJ family two-component response regulator